MTTPDTPDDAEKQAVDEQELLEWRDLQAAQMTSMTDVWDNPEDERWNDLPLDESECPPPPMPPILTFSRPLAPALPESACWLLTNLDKKLKLAVLRGQTS